MYQLLCALIAFLIALYFLHRIFFVASQNLLDSSAMSFLCVVHDGSVVVCFEADNCWVLSRYDVNTGGRLAVAKLDEEPTGMTTAFFKDGVRLVLAYR